MEMQTKNVNLSKADIKIIQDAAAARYLKSDSAMLRIIINDWYLMQAVMTITNRPGLPLAAQPVGE